MSKNLRKCMKTMHLFCCTQNKKLRKSILDEMSKEECFFEALYEIVNNVFLKNIDFKKLTPAQKRKAKKFLPLLRKIHKHPKSKGIRRKIVKQTGGWISFVLPILTSVVGEIINNAVRKKSNTSSS